MAQQSFFSYSITRRYPFPWFTPVVIIGGIVATALVSFLNVASTGYDLVPSSSDDPNGTESNSAWFSKWPPYLVGARASCEASNIPIQSVVYTKTGAFRHTLSKIWYFSDGEKLYKGSLIYKDYPLESCNITHIDIQYETADRTAGQMLISPMGATLTSTTQCYVSQDGNRTYLELISSFDAMAPSELESPGHQTLNETKYPSIYFGYLLLGVYWHATIQDFFDEDTNREVPYGKGYVKLQQNVTLLGTMDQQVRSAEFLSVQSCTWVPLNTSGVAYMDNRYCGYHLLSELASGPDAFNRTSRYIPELPANFPGSWLANLVLIVPVVVNGIWNSVGQLAKVMWFTVLADLGRDDDAMPNMLARPELLASLSANLTQVNQTLRPSFRWGVNGLPFLETFDPTRHPDVYLGVNQTQLSSEYLCQVPKLKSPGTLVVSVLVADLVILQAIWKLFTLAVASLCIKNPEEARCCSKCASVEVDEQQRGYQSCSSDDSTGIPLREQ